MKTKLLLLLFILGISAQSQTITFPDTVFKNQLLAANSSNSIAKNQAGTNVAIDTNGDGQIQVSEALGIYQLVISYTAITNLSGIENFTNLRKLSCSSIGITSLNVTALTNLTELAAVNGQLTNLNASGLTNLTNLSCRNNQISTLNLTGTNNLTDLACQTNQLQVLNLSGKSQLTTLDCYSNQMTSLNLTACSSLTSARVYSNLLNTLNVSDCPALYSLDCYSNNITSLDLSHNPALLWVDCHSNLISSLNVQGCSLMSNLTANNNLLTTVDISDTRITTLYVNNNQLTSLFVKNGKFETLFYIMNNPNLAYICCDESQLVSVQNAVVIYGIPNCTVNTYCSFVPGGSYDTIEGNARVDYNANGCDQNDFAYPNMRFDVTSGSVTSNLFANDLGHYAIALPQGTYTINPRLENPTYFTVSPASLTATIPLATDPMLQDFCLSMNGIHRDLECWIVPLSIARPGFDSRYKIVYKNKGTQVMSGNITFAFDDDYMDFISATVLPNSQSFSLLSWNYANLLPFERREIVVTLNLNSPQENLPLHIGDIIKFGSTIFPLAEDETATDNSHGIRQVVVASLDPNDKTCLEGTIVAPELAGEYVHYMIRFENTGTFAAENVVVRDLIDTAKFDISTLVPLSSSHSYVTKISNTNKVEFIFENINLPFDDANNDGYIVFKIKTKPTLVVGDTFSNSASIYFDYNFPIITNTATTTIQLLKTPDFEFNTMFSLSPVPTGNVLSISNKQNVAISSVSIYNTLGQLILVDTNPEKDIDVSELKSGTYFIKIVSDKGAASSKFIKE